MGYNPFSKLNTAAKIEKAFVTESKAAYFAERVAALGASARVVLVHGEGLKQGIVKAILQGRPLAANLTTERVAEMISTLSCGLGVALATRIRAGLSKVWVNGVLVERNAQALEAAHLAMMVESAPICYTNWTMAQKVGQVFEVFARSVGSQYGTLYTQTRSLWQKLRNMLLRLPSIPDNIIVGANKIATGIEEVKGITAGTWAKMAAACADKNLRRRLFTTGIDLGSKKNKLKLQVLAHIDTLLKMGQNTEKLAIASNGAIEGVALLPAVKVVVKVPEDIAVTAKGSISTVLRALEDEISVVYASQLNGARLTVELETVAVGRDTLQAYVTSLLP